MEDKSEYLNNSEFLSLLVKEIEEKHHQENIWYSGTSETPYGIDVNDIISKINFDDEDNIVDDDFMVLKL